MNKNEAKELRGFILTICKVSYPGGASHQLINITLDNAQFAVSPAVVDGHIKYLEEKGYIRQEEAKCNSTGICRDMVFITAQGLDLMEGNIPPDPGILVPETG